MILPCPFCEAISSQPILLNNDPYSLPVRAAFQCGHCLAQGPSVSAETAAEAKMLAQVMWGLRSVESEAAR